MAAALLFFPLLLPPTTAAEFLYRSDAAVVPKQKRGSARHRLITRANVRELERISGQRLNLPRSEALKEYPIPVHLFRVKSLPPGAGTWDGLPPCRANGERQVPLPSDGALEGLDLIVYQYGDRSQEKKAKKAGTRAVAYVEGALVNPHRDKGDSTQALLRILPLRCLPSALKHVADQAGRHYLTVREGGGAWHREGPARPGNRF